MRDDATISLRIPAGPRALPTAGIIIPGPRPGVFGV